MKSARKVRQFLYVVLLLAVVAFMLGGSFALSYAQDPTEESPDQAATEAPPQDIPNTGGSVVVVPIDTSPPAAPPAAPTDAVASQSQLNTVTILAILSLLFNILQVTGLNVNGVLAILRNRDMQTLIRQLINGVMTPEERRKLNAYLGGAGEAAGIGQEWTRDDDNARSAGRPPFNPRE